MDLGQGGYVLTGISTIFFLKIVIGWKKRLTFQDMKKQVWGEGHA